jgi:hypothetical protein
MTTCIITFPTPAPTSRTFDFLFHPNSLMMYLENGQVIFIRLQYQHNISNRKNCVNSPLLQFWKLFHICYPLCYIAPSWKVCSFMFFFSENIKAQSAQISTSYAQPKNNVSEWEWFTLHILFRYILLILMECSNPFSFFSSLVSWVPTISPLYSRWSYVTSSHLQNMSKVLCSTFCVHLVGIGGLYLISLSWTGFFWIQ